MQKRQALTSQNYQFYLIILKASWDSINIWVIMTLLVFKKLLHPHNNYFI